MRAFNSVAFCFAVSLWLVSGHANAAGAVAQVTDSDGNFYSCRMSYYGCKPALLTDEQRAVVDQAKLDRNYDSCKADKVECDKALLTAGQTAAANDATRGLNLENCRTGNSRCDRTRLSADEKDEIARAGDERNLHECQMGFYGCDPSRLTDEQKAGVAEATLERAQQSKAQPSPSTDGAPCVENGSCYGDLNASGVPKTVGVRGYYRKDGTYVRGYYRSAPRRR